MNSTAAGSIRAAFWLFTLAAMGFALNLGLGINRKQPSGPMIHPAKAASVQPAVQSSSPPLSRYSGLSKSLVFGPEGQGAAAPPPLMELNLPKVAGYRLIGLMTGSRKHALAVVEETATGRQRIAGIGEDLGPGTLVAVFTDRVVVETGGKRRQLIMSDRTAEEISGVITLREGEGRSGSKTKENSQSGSGSLKRPKNMVSAPVGKAQGAQRKTGNKSGPSLGRASTPEFSSTREISGTRGLD